MLKRSGPANFIPVTGSRCSFQGLQLTQAGLCFVLCALIAVLGSLAYFETKEAEIFLFRSQFKSASLTLTESITGGLLRKSMAASLVSDMFSHGHDKSTSQNFPNFTLPGFESSMNQVCDLSGFRFLAYSPLVTDVTRAGWEEYARKNVGLLEGPPSLTTSTNGSFTVADGMVNITTRGKAKHSGYISQSKYPTWFFPVWQVAPVLENHHAVMYDPHAFSGSRLLTIDKALDAGAGRFTDIVHLVLDGHKSPATIHVLPVKGRTVGNPIVGLITGGFTWVDILQGILPHNYEVICVLKTKTSTSTFILNGSKAKFMGLGDYHDSAFEDYAVPFSPIPDTDYRVIIYPTRRLMDQFVTNKPTISCVIVVITIAFTASLVLLYSHLVKNRENKLREEAARSLAGASSRDAVLHAKKLYVRYISHEIRTPLNAAHLGLKILENEIRKEKGPHAKNRLSTVQDIAHACDIAVGILNDLLNYDRLEDGTLIIEPRKILALPFFISTTNLFLLQAEEKGVTFKFDVAEFSHHNDVIINAGAGAAGANLLRALSDIKATEYFLGNNDYVNVDQHKMSQVVRNLVSNAIKFTPEGGTVTIKLRKIPSKKFIRDDNTSIIIDTDTSIHHKRPPNIAASSASSNSNIDLRQLRDLESGKLYSDAGKQFNDAIPVSRKVIEDDGDLGTLVLEVIDSGVGMAAEDSKRLFKEVIQFNPSELQAGGGSGLGMMITKALADLHGGEVSVSSAGKGLGSVFTVTLPLSSPPTTSNIITTTTPTSLHSSTRSPSHGVRTHLSKDGIHDNSLGESVCASDRLTALLYNNCSNHSINIPTSPIEKNDDIPPGLNSIPSNNLLLHGNGNNIRDLNSVSSCTESKDEHAIGYKIIPTDLHGLLFGQSTTVCPILDESVVETSSMHETSSILSVCPPKNLRLLNILVVDDSKLNRKMLVKYLKLDNHTVHEAEDGLIAISKVVENMHKSRKKNFINGSYDCITLPITTIDNKKHDILCDEGRNISGGSAETVTSSNIEPSINDEMVFFYDAILMDFMMPNMDGPTATRAIRDLGYAGLILGVTGNALPSDIEHFLLHGANEVLIKPVNIAALEAALYPILNAS